MHDEPPTWQASYRAARAWISCVALHLVCNVASRPTETALRIHPRTNLSPFPFERGQALSEALFPVEHPPLPTRIG